MCLTSSPSDRLPHRYDGVFKLSVRRHVKPCFADLRHILNVAQLSACAPALHMVTTDGDGTIYRHNQVRLPSQPNPPRSEFGVKRI